MNKRYMKGYRFEIRVKRGEEVEENKPKPVFDVGTSQGKRKERIRIRVTQAEKQYLLLLAEQEGLALSDLIRKRLGLPVLEWRRR